MPGREQLAYFARSALRYFDRAAWFCPSCGSGDYERVSRKALVTSLVRCHSCRLLYRTPVDPFGFTDRHYQSDYTSGGLTTTLPQDNELLRLLETGFRRSNKNFTDKIKVLEALGVPRGARVLDFGASWGYATWQLRRAGYDASGYEISKPRAVFGEEKLGIRIATKEADLNPPYDAIFSSHVIEHFADPGDALDFGRRLLGPRGVFVAFTPNGSLQRLGDREHHYDHSWGRLHPVYLDEEFCQRELDGLPIFLTSRRYGDWADLSDVADWDRRASAQVRMTRPELLLVFVNG